MPNPKLILCIVASSAIATSACAAPNPVGTWKGHLELTSGQKKKLGKAMVDEVAKVRMDLNLKADHTFTIKASLGPGDPETDAGKWTVTGSTVTLKAKGGFGTCKCTLNKNGHTMTGLEPDKEAPGGVDRIVFTR